MDVKIIYGASRKNNTNHCIEQMNQCIEKNHAKEVVILVPEQFSALYEDRLTHQSLEHGLFRMQVLTFKRLSHILFHQTMTDRSNAMDHAGKSMLIYEILQKMPQLQVFQKPRRYPSFSAQISKLIQELKRYQIQPQVLNDFSNRHKHPFTKQKFNELSQIYEMYNQQMESKNHCDADDDLSYLAKLIKQTGFFKETMIWIDGFDGFTPQEVHVIEKIKENAKRMTFSFCTDRLECDEKTDVFYPVIKTIKELVEKLNTKISTHLIDEKQPQSNELTFLIDHLFSYHSSQYDKHVQNISMYKGYDPYQEVQHSILTIKKQMRENGYRYKDFCIVANPLEEYRSYIETQFQKHQIPYFLDERRPIMRHPLIAYLLSVLDVYVEKFSYSAVFSCLKSPYSDFSQKDIHVLENYVLRWGIKGVGMWKETWQYQEDDSIEEKQKVEKINAIKNQWLDQILPFFHGIKQRNTAKVFVEYFYRFLQDQNIQQKLKQMIENAVEPSYKQELTQSWNVLMNVLDQIHVVVDEPKTVEDFKHLMHIGFLEYHIGVTPPSFDYVAIGSLNRTHVMEAKMLLVLGANEPFPAEGITQEGIITDKERSELEKQNITVAQDTKSQMINSALNVYHTLSIPSEKLYLSQSMVTGEGKQKVSAHFYDRIQAMFENMEQDSSSDHPRWMYQTHIHPPKSDSTPTEDLGVEGAKHLYPDTLYTSVSQLERFNQCPFSYYIQYGLGLKEREVFSLHRLQMGLVLHDLIKELTHVAKEKELVDYPSCLQETFAVYHQLFQDDPVLQRNKRLKHMGYRLCQRAAYGFYMSMLQIKAGKFQPDQMEIKLPPIPITLSDDQTVILSGRVDRVDKTQGEHPFYRVIDYKSSGKSLALYRIHAGLDLQLPVYLYGLQNVIKASPAGMYYFEIDKPLTKVRCASDHVTIEKEKSKQIQLSGYTLDDPLVWELTDEHKTNHVVQQRKTLNTSELEHIFDHVKYEIKNVSQNIYQGYNKALPSYDGQPACTYCLYKDICGFDIHKAGCRYRYISKKKDDEINWERKE